MMSLGMLLMLPTGLSSMAAVNLFAANRRLDYFAIPSALFAITFNYVSSSRHYWIGSLLLELFCAQGTGTHVNQFPISIGRPT